MFRYDRLSLACLKRLIWLAEQYPNRVWQPALYRANGSQLWRPVQVDWESHGLTAFLTGRKHLPYRLVDTVSVVFLTSTLPGSVFRTYRVSATRVRRVNLDLVSQAIEKLNLNAGQKAWERRSDRADQAKSAAGGGTTGFLFAADGDGSVRCPGRTRSRVQGSRPSTAG